MMDGSALAARAIGDAARRDLPSEWAGPAPPGAPTAPPPAREGARGGLLHKP